MIMILLNTKSVLINELLIHCKSVKFIIKIHILLSIKYRKHINCLSWENVPFQEIISWILADFEFDGKITSQKSLPPSSVPSSGTVTELLWKLPHSCLMQDSTCSLVFGLLCFWFFFFLSCHVFSCWTAVEYLLYEVLLFQHCPAERLSLQKTAEHVLL